MPKLIRLYIVNVAIGFVIAAIFVGALIAFDIGGLRHLVTGSSDGYLALFLMWFFNGIVFAGVQFGIYVMSMAERDDNGRGMGIPDYLPVRVRAERARTPLNRAMQRRDR